jgi:hypothetical protein
LNASLSKQSLYKVVKQPPHSRLQKTSLHRLLLDDEQSA